MLPGVLVVLEGRGRGRGVGALDVGLLGLGARPGLRLVRRLGVGDERHGPARDVEQLAQDVGLLELGEKLDELGQRGGVLKGDADRVARHASGGSRFVP